MKKFLLLFTAMLMLGVTAHAAIGDEFTVGNFHYRVLSETDRTVTLKGYVEAPVGELTIPSSVTKNSTTYSVMTLWAAFDNCSGLTSVIIPNSVKVIDGYAFRNCTNLVSVSIPTSVTQLGESAFSGCTSLASITLPNSITSLNNRTFSGCTALTSIVIPPLVTKLGQSIFNNCTGLTSIIITKSIKEIDPQAFYRCTSLESFTVEEGNTNFASVDGVLYNYSRSAIVLFPAGKKGSFEIPNTVTSIKESAFATCPGLTTVTIPNSVISIGARAFCECSGLTSVSIPNTVTKIEKYTFDECKALSTVTIPSSVVLIEDDAFSHCESLENIWCMAVTPPELPTYASSVFYGVPKDKTVLHVPAESTAVYSQTDYWKDFINIKGDAESASINDIDEESNSDAVYFNLNGVRVENPENGLYIKYQGNKATKVFVK